MKENHTPDIMISDKEDSGALAQVHLGCMKREREEGSPESQNQVHEEGRDIVQIRHRIVDPREDEILEKFDEPGVNGRRGGDLRMDLDGFRNRGNRASSLSQHHFQSSTAILN